MFTRVIVALVALAVAFAILGADGQPVIKKVPPSRTSAASGAQMYDTYCATCHGKDGKGGGPAASALRVPVPDITRMAADNNGVFPELRVYGSIKGDPVMPAAHGSKDMPVWGDVFQSMTRGDNSIEQMRIANLTAYIKGLQAK